MADEFPESLDAVTVWADAHGVAHLLAFSAFEVAPQAGWIYSVRAVSVADVFDPAFDSSSGRSPHVRPNTVRSFLWAWLKEKAAELDGWRDVPLQIAPPVEPQFAGFFQRLDAWRTPTLGFFPRTTLYARVAVDDVLARVELPSSEVHAQRITRPSVALPYNGDEGPRCSCGRTLCWHSCVAIDAMQRWLTTGDPYSQHTLARNLRPSWEKVFDAVKAAAPVPPPAALTHLGFRIDFHLLNDFEHQKAITVVVESAKGKPKSINAREALRGSAQLPMRDRRTLERIIEVQRDRQTHTTQVELLRGLVGHPGLLLRENRKDTPLQLKSAPIQIEVAEKAKGVEVRLRLEGALLRNPRWFSGDTGVVAVELNEDLSVLWLGELPASAWAFVKAIRYYGGEFPAEAGPQLMKTLEGLGPVSLTLPPSLEGSALPVDPRLRVRVVPGHGLSLTMSLHVEPLPGELPQKPGQGAAAMASWRNEGRIFTTRDLDAERQAAADLERKLGLPPPDEDGVWHLEQPDVVLTVIEQLQQLGERVVVQTVGSALRMSRPVAISDLALTVTKKTDWFALEGDVRVDARVVPIARVIEAIRGGQTWVDLGDHQFARLSEKLLSSLAPIALSGRARGDLTEVTLADAPLIEALTPEVEALTLAADFGRIVKRMRESATLEVRLPKGFKGTLRDYQLEGFAWLSRLAAWGAGAVLADDMGLGKTVQTLALLLSRAKLGPALVVAPTSVAPNWAVEAKKFAPSLRVTMLRDVDREATIAAAKAGDVLVISWGLLVQEQDALSKKQFETVVLDEAQALKNANTQRAYAARALKAGFVVALSGTPMENRLAELWSLFRAVLPGLLGGHDSFRERFVMPIERDHSDVARQALRSLVQPFLLRRTKDSVAKELPRRTDIRLEVPLSEVEFGVYEAARLEAVAHLDALGSKKPETHFHVLAALTRLRQLACHVGLVDPSWSGPSSKLSRLYELIAELKASGHKVLVFSQFTSLLDRVEAGLDPSVCALRLDGSTPDRERQVRVAAFQRGEADVFLLSLKAGGTGLNLTAADYVVHLDPWWNPAVEDQASDRAHRLGQTKPVTVYRLVAKGTVEEGILALHGTKRALVNSVLDGSHTAGGLTTKQLMELVTGAP